MRGEIAEPLFRPQLVRARLVRVRVTVWVRQLVRARLVRVRVTVWVRQLVRGSCAVATRCASGRLSPTDPACIQAAAPCTQAAAPFPCPFHAHAHA
eukprot:scaffold62494_cov40-Phaeocystis_antarctica.AAC.3